MSSRKIKVNGVMTKFSFDKNKKYKYNSSGNVVEATTVSDDDIVLSGSKSSLRRMSDMERNISILATKTVTTAGALDVSIDEVDGLQTVLNSKATPANVSTSLASAKSYTDGKVADLVSSAPGTLNTLNELAAALGDDPSFATTVTNSIATKLPLSGGTMSGTLNIVTGDTSESVINLLGGSQGTGKLYVGQSTTHGGGIEYNGDGTPSSSGSGADYVTLYRRTAGVDSWTARNIHNGNDWKFRGNLYANDTSRVFADNYHPNADKWTTARTLTLSGDASGSVSWDGSGDASLSVTVADDSHNHTIANVDGLQTELDGKLSTSGKAADANLLDGINSTSFLRSDSNDSTTGSLTIINDAGLKIRSTTNAGGAEINFSDQTDATPYTKQGTLEYKNLGTIGGGGPAFKFHGTETHLTVHVDGRIYATGDVTAYYSDERLKDFSGKIENALDKVSQLNGYHYTGNEVAGGLGYDTSAQQVGVSAQEVQSVLPEVVKSAPINADSDTDYMTVQYERMVPLLIEAIKELKSDNEELRSMIEELKK